jgi:hypothetical protein
MTKSLRFDRSITSDNPMTAEESRSGECILARLVAAAYAADHPESLGRERVGGLEEELTERSEGHILQAGGTISCCKQLTAPDHTS